MNLYLASTAELYAEHRRTGSTRKRQRIANELQRRHDELNCRPGQGLTWWAFGEIRKVWIVGFPGVFRMETCEYEIRRYDFALFLSGLRSPQSAIR